MGKRRIGGMIPYAIWSNRELRGLGKDALLLSAYLASNRHGNAFYLYELPLEYVALETQIDAKRIKDLLRTFHENDFCLYDEETEHVWARAIMLLNCGRSLKTTDKRYGCGALEGMTASPIVDRFLNEFGVSYGLITEEDKPPLCPLEAPFKQGEEKGEVEVEVEEKGEGEAEAERERGFGGKPKLVKTSD